MHKLLLIFLTMSAIAGCVSMGPKTPVVVQTGLSQGKNLLDASGKELPVRISLRLGDARPKPTVLVGHGSGGVSPSELNQAFAVFNWGYNAVVVDHYTARGIKVHTGVPVNGGLPNDRAADMIAVAKWVKQQPWHTGKIAIIGFSQGGAGIWALANEKNMRSHLAIEIAEEDLRLISAGVAMYPACHATFASPPIDPLFPVQLHLAGSDDLALPHWCETFGNSKYDKHIYPGATHVFDFAGVIPNNTRFTHRYDREATELSQSRIKSYLALHLKD